MQTHCDAGCQQAFAVEQFETKRIHDGIDKVFFTCPHCGHEYVAFYTDPEIRDLQAKIRRIQQRFAKPNADHVEAAKREAEVKQLIKDKMDALRNRIEQP